MTFRYTSEINVIVGPNKDIPAPDVNTKEQIMAWMMYPYFTNQGSTASGTVAGKPVSLGGQAGSTRGRRARRIRGGMRSCRAAGYGHQRRAHRGAEIR